MKIPEKAAKWLSGCTPAEGSRNATLYGVTQSLAAAGWTRADADSLLDWTRIAQRDTNLPMAEVESVVASAFASTVAADGVAKNREKLTRPSKKKFEYIYQDRTGPVPTPAAAPLPSGMSPLPEPITGIGAVAAWVSALWHDGESLVIVPQKLEDDGTPSWRGMGQAWTRENLLARLRDGHGLEKLFPPHPGCGLGVMVNPATSRGLAGVRSFRHALLEWDNGTIDQQWEWAQRSGLPIVSVVHSGGKSLHCVVRVDAPNEVEFKERTKSALEHIKRIGLPEPDKCLTDPSRSVRAPEYPRGENRQQLISLCLGAADWSAWEAVRNKARATAMLAHREFDPDNPPPRTEPVLWLRDVGIAKSGDLVAISAQSKSGKSAAIGAIIASLIGAEGRDYLGFRANGSEGTILHFDTEQSPEDHHDVVARALRRADVSGRQECLRSYCVSDLSTQERRDALFLALDVMPRPFRAIIIDGVADLCCDVNDAEESNEIVGMLFTLAVRERCPVVCVLHENPGQSKTRGHLGSQLERKAASNIRLDKSPDGRVEIYAEKARRGHIAKGAGPCFCWSDAAGMHVSAESKKDSAAAVERDRLEELAVAAFAQTSATLLASGELTKRLCGGEGGSERTARRKMADMVNLGIIMKEGNFYRLMVGVDIPCDGPY